MTNKTEQKECITRYRAYTPCWSIPAGEERFTCARNVLGLKASLADELAACTGLSAVACKQSLREKVLYMIKFRFYDLNQRAEDLANRGANLNAVADLETTIETKKQEFDRAKTTGEFQRIVEDVRAAWQTFVNQIKGEVH